jgi:hypothetical protein
MIASEIERELVIFTRNKRALAFSWHTLYGAIGKLHSSAYADWTRVKKLSKIFIDSFEKPEQDSIGTVFGDITNTHAELNMNSHLVEKLFIVLVSTKRAEDHLILHRLISINKYKFGRILSYPT